MEYKYGDLILRGKIDYRFLYYSFDKKLAFVEMCRKPRTYWIINV